MFGFASYLRVAVSEGSKRCMSGTAASNVGMLPHMKDVAEALHRMGRGDLRLSKDVDSDHGILSNIHLAGSASPYT